jgi:long-chain fatty acid transport protein
MKNNNKKFFRYFFVPLFSFFVSPAIADQFHYKNIIVGERASGLGGAYTAVADDPSGLFYNPAGIIYAKQGNLSASVNAYHTSTKTYKDALAGSIDWERSSAAFLPNFFAFTQPLGDGVVGFSYAVPDAVSENQDQTFLNPNSVWTSLTVNYNDEDLTYKIGPSYAIELTKGLSVGLTVYYHYRERERISNELAVQPGVGGNDYQVSNTYFETFETGIQPMLGVMWSPLEKLSFGLNISKTTINNSRTTIQTQQKAFADEEIQQTSIRIDEVRELPLIVSVGLAWFPSSSMMIAGDLTNYSATEDEITGTREAITNFAVGLEYYASSSLAYRTGIYSNYANTPGLVEGGTGQNEHINYYGFTASVSSVTRSSTISFGLAHSIGSGLAQVVSGSTELQDVEGSSTTLLLSTSYSY